MRELSKDQLMEIEGGGINLDVNELVRQMNPYHIGQEFGRSVVYPYVWKPLKKLFS